MYALIDGDQVLECPLSLDTWRASHPNISIPSNPTKQQLEEQSIVSVETSAEPQFDYRLNFASVIKKGEDNKWYQHWESSPASEEQIQSRTAKQADSVRLMRNQRLSDCDWTQLPDAPVNAESWSEYRQALRDIPSQEGFPWEIIWPVTPRA